MKRILSALILITTSAASAIALEPCQENPTTTIARAFTGAGNSDGKHFFDQWFLIKKSTVSLNLAFPAGFSPGDLEFDFVKSASDLRFQPICGKWVGSTWTGSIVLPPMMPNGEHAFCVSTGGFKDCTTLVDLRLSGHRRLGGMLRYAPSRPPREEAPAKGPARQVCVTGDSLGQKIRIHVDKQEIYSGVLKVDPKFSPQVSCFNALSEGSLSVLRITGGSFKSRLNIDWHKGPRVIVGLERQGKATLTQDDGKAGFE